MLNELIIEQTPKTPQIDLNQLTGDLIISGKSIPENASKVYQPVFDWVTEYILNARPTTNFRLNLEYFNTASALWLAKILKTLICIDDPDYILLIHLYLSVEDFNDINDYEDIKDFFIPLECLDYKTIPSIGIKLYGTDDKGELIVDRFLFIEEKQFTSSRSQEGK